MNSRMPCSITFMCEAQANAEIERVNRLWGIEPAQYVTFTRGDRRFDVLAEYITNPLDRVSASEITLMFRGSRFVGAIPPIDAGEITFTNEETCTVAPKESFQSSVKDWTEHTFGPSIANDLVERAERAVEEMLEAGQTVDGFTRERAHMLVDYVFDMPKGDRARELGSALVTLAAFASASHIDLNEAGNTELARCWRESALIQQRHASKPKIDDKPRGIENEVDIDGMVARFLAWPLPDHVNPDGEYPAGKWREKWGSSLSGTNLLDATTAHFMFSHCLVLRRRPDSAIAKLNAELMDETIRRSAAEKKVDELQEALAAHIAAPGEFGRMTGVGLIARERNRHFEKGYGSGHDDEHTQGELARAACVYALPPIGTGYPIQEYELADAIWPAEWEMPSFTIDDSDPNRINELAIAGSLIAAELDRRIRAGQLKTDEAEPTNDIGSGPLSFATLRFVDEAGNSVIASGSIPLGRLINIAHELVAHPMPVFMPRKIARKLADAVPEDSFETAPLDASAEDYTRVIRPPEDFTIDAHVQVHRIVPSASDKAHSFEMGGVRLRSVPIAALLEQAVRDLIARIEATRIKSNEPPSSIRDAVEFPNAVLEAARRIRAEERNAFTLDACFIPRDPLTDPRPGDKYVVDSAELLVIARDRNFFMTGSDRVTFVPIEMVRSPYSLFGAAVHERAGTPSTVDLDVFVASVSTAADVSERGPRIFSHWTAVNLAPGCSLDAASGKVTLSEPMDFLDRHANIWSTIAPVYASGEIGPDKRVSVCAADMDFQRFTEGFAEALSGSLGTIFGTSQRDSEN